MEPEKREIELDNLYDKLSTRDQFLIKINEKFNKGKHGMSLIKFVVEFFKNKFLNHSIH